MLFRSRGQVFTFNTGSDLHTGQTNLSALADGTATVTPFAYDRAGNYVEGAAQTITLQVFDIQSVKTTASGQIVITFNQALDSTQVLNVADFAVRTDGDLHPITGYTIQGNQLILQSADALIPNAVGQLSLSFDATHDRGPAASAITDVNGHSKSLLTWSSSTPATFAYAPTIANVSSEIGRAHV